jgi:hypothetical protein
MMWNVTARAGETGESSAAATVNFFIFVKWQLQ